MTCHSAAMARACSILTGTPHRPVPGASVALDYQVKLRPPGFVRHRRVERFAVFLPDNTHETCLPVDGPGSQLRRRTNRCALRGERASPCSPLVGHLLTSDRATTLRR